MARITSAAPRVPGPPDGPARDDDLVTRRRQGETGHVTLAALTAAIAASAYYGALGLISGFLPLGATVTSRLPFASPVLGGIALAIVVAIPATVTCWLAARRDRRTGDASLLLGILLAGWIVAELALIRQLSFLQPLFIVVSGVLIGLGLRARQPGEQGASR